VRAPFLLLALAMAWVLCPVAVADVSNPPGDALPGQSLFRRGVLLSGEPVQAHRENRSSVSGVEVACVNCHRRSGLGTVEGRIVVPPVDASTLFHPATRNPPHGGGEAREADPRNQTAYDDALLARAIRTGVGSDGRTLSALMPRYELDHENMAALLAYLHGLGVAPVPGVEAETLHFATIITSDADPVAARAMLEVLEQFFATRNASYRGDSPPLQSARRIHFRVLRQWRLHVWRLTGPSSTWERQLEAHLEAEPVYAVISGIGRTTWDPVHRFCEHQSIPCLLPNVDLPTVAEKDFYPIYFSQGVLLEARMLVYRIGAAVGRPRIVQVYRTHDIGAAAAAALREAAPPDMAVEDRALPETAGIEQLAAAARVAAGDTLVLWLRPDDLASLPGRAPDQAVYLSGLMGGLDEAPLPAAWRNESDLTYPVELPDKRRARMNYPLGWFAIHKIPVVAERIQTDTYIACTVLAEALGTMRDDFVRDYLVERIESMVSTRLLNGYYPRLSLAPGQRFASKGGYFVHAFEKDGKSMVVADGPWTVPWGLPSPR